MHMSTSYSIPTENYAVIFIWGKKGEIYLQVGQKVTLKMKIFTP